MKEIYVCLINGKFYGSGSLRYIKELFVDYVITCKMYDKDEVDFKIMEKSAFENRLSGTRCVRCDLDIIHGEKALMNDEKELAHDNCIGFDDLDENWVECKLIK